MAYTIKLGNFEKKENSTAQPSTTNWAEYDVVFKEGMDFNSPVVKLNLDYATAKSYNYAQLNNEFFWIVGRTMLRTDLCQLQLEKDVLATYKSDIGSTQLYISRASADFDGAIRDSYYPPKGAATYYHDIDDEWSPVGYNDGYYILNIMGVNGVDAQGQPVASAVSTLWQLRPSEFRKLVSNLYEEIDGFQFSDWSSALTKFFAGDPTNLVSSAMWFPKPFAAAMLQEEEILVGKWHTSCYGKLISDPKTTITAINYSIRKHPLAASRGKYLNLEPYSRYFLYVPWLGGMALDTTKMIDCDIITVYPYVDALSGICIANVYARDAQGNIKQSLGSLTAQVGVPLPLQGQSSGSSVIAGGLATAGAVASAVASGGATIPTIAAAGTAMGGITDAMTGQTVNIGSSGSALAMSVAPYLDTVFYDIPAEDNANNGRPLCAVRTPASLGGFMKVEKGIVKIDGTLVEEQKIENFLEAGFYYE